ncbi:MAG: HAD hydrolase family protein [Verrucomicrobia bacterium]|nr:HAD hydrolase family protein [Verrucomicrobiota bacterium]
MVKTASPTKLISWVDYSLFHANDLNWIKGSIAIGLCIHGLALRVLVEFTPPIGLLYVLVHCGLAVGAFLSIILLAPPLFQETIKACREKSVSIGSGLLLGVLLLYFTSLTASIQYAPWAYYEVIPTVLTLYAVIRYWMARKKRQVFEALPVLFDRVERCNRVEPDGSVSRIPLVDLKVGEAIKISTSQVVPVDGVVVMGEGYVTEGSLNGSTFPNVKQPGDPILAGSVSLDGVFTVKTLSPYVPRKLEAISHPLLSCEMQNQSDRRTRISRVGSVALTGILASLGFGIGLFHSGLYPALILTSTILILGASLVWIAGIPVHYWTGLVHLSKRGLLGKKPELIAEIASINRAFFGKTGVLSHEEPKLAQFFVMPAFQNREDWIKSLVYQTSRMVHHPLVNSLSGVESLIQGEPVVEDLKYKIIPGKRIEVTLTDGLGQRLKLKIGEPDSVLGKMGITPFIAILEEHDLLIGQRIWISLNDRVCAIAQLKEAWSVAPQPFFSQLALLDIRSGILTGDKGFNDTRLEGISCRQGMTAKNKQKRVEQAAQSNEKVLMVGDGFNDFRAMSSAHVSLAMRHAPDAVLGSASGILKSSHLHALLFCIPYCRKIMTLSKKNNWVFSTAMIAASSAAIAGWLNPLGASILFLASFVFVWVQSFLLSRSILSSGHRDRDRRINSEQAVERYARNR